MLEVRYGPSGDRGDRAKVGGAEHVRGYPRGDQPHRGYADPHPSRRRGVEQRRLEEYHGPTVPPTPRAARVLSVSCTTPTLCSNNTAIEVPECTLVSSSAK
eukprot:CAMPEP_0181128754 /NCGR_PEP_ID=MMETSP1071-20121207/28941_1 /TAXON_ID=35127 /ORGANISM="Thalassiosira sp., Strain NH16" /LENGTH=100 /DNA_ID=CAMNT_0023214663 /DNA_START=295 /DNA_END=594 /DNA_ORIENTATION=-